MSGGQRCETAVTSWGTRGTPHTVLGTKGAAGRKGGEEGAERGKTVSQPQLPRWGCTPAPAPPALLAECRQRVQGSLLTLAHLSNFQNSRTSSQSNAGGTARHCTLSASPHSEERVWRHQPGGHADSPGSRLSVKAGRSCLERPHMPLCPCALRCASKHPRRG